MNKLNLGSGNDYKKGFVNLDYNSKYKLDVNHNLNKFPYPFKEDQFDYVYCSHILEHVEDLFKTLKELERITKIGGLIHIKVPHFSNGNGYNDLSHKRFFGWFTFDQILNSYYNNDFDFLIEDKRFNFIANNRLSFFSIFYNLMPKKFYERFLCWIFPVGEIEIKLRKIAKDGYYSYVDHTYISFNKQELER